LLVEEPGVPLKHEDIKEGTIDGAVRRLRPKLMIVIAVLQSLAPVLWTTGIGSDLMKSIAAPIEGFKITSTIRALIMVPVFFALINVSALHHGTLESSDQP